LRGEAHRAALHELALIAERERIARDLHDDVIQRLFGLGMAMSKTQRLVGL
jgi:signal transduction histidine kinase